MKRRELLALLPAVAVAGEKKSKAERAGAWMKAFDDVVDEARAIPMGDLDVILTTIRTCCLANSLDKMADVLRPIYDGTPESFRTKRISE